MKIFDEDDFVQQISNAGEAFANDLNDEIEGKFGFSVGDYDEDVDAYSVTASWEPCLDEDEEVEGRDGDYGPVQKQRFWLVPMSPDQVNKPSVDVSEGAQV
jgi:hypothetical protein